MHLQTESVKFTPSQHTPQYAAHKTRTTILYAQMCCATLTIHLYMPLVTVRKNCSMLHEPQNYATMEKTLTQKKQNS